MQNRQNYYTTVWTCCLPTPWILCSFNLPSQINYIRIRKAPKKSKKIIWNGKHHLQEGARSYWAGDIFSVWKHGNFDVIMILKNCDLHRCGEEEETGSCAFYYKNCGTSNEAGGRQILKKKKSKEMVPPHQAADLSNSLWKDAMRLQSIYMISFCSASI